MEFYSKRRIHFSLDIKNDQTPLMTLHAKKYKRCSEKTTLHGWRISMTSEINFHI